MILDPGFDLTLRPMKYPAFYDQYKAAIKNTWTVEEVDLAGDLADLQQRMTPAERHLINRLVAFFATGDSIVGNNLVLNLYKHINSPEARMYLSRQLFEEAQHVEFYLTLLDTYISDPQERKSAFDAVENIESIRKKARILFSLDRFHQRPHRNPHHRRPPQFSDEPDLLRLLHRGSVLFRGIRLRLFPAVARPAAGLGHRHQLGVPRRKRAHRFRLRSDPNRPHGRARHFRSTSSKRASPK